MEFRKRGSLTSGNLSNEYNTVVVPYSILSFPSGKSCLNNVCIVAGSLLLSCLLGVSLTILIILTVFYLRRHFTMPTQFYPNHVKLFSKEQLTTDSENGAKPDKKLKGKVQFFILPIDATLRLLKDIQFYFPEYECILTFLSCLRYQRKYFRSKFKGCLITLLF